VTQVWSENPARPTWARAGRDGTNAMAPDTLMTDEVSPFTLASNIWTRQVISLGLGQVRTTSWATDARELPHGDFYGRHEHHRETLITRLDGEHGPYAAYLQLSDGRVNVRVAAREQETSDLVIAGLREQVPVGEIDPEEPRVAVTFWSLGVNGPTGRSRKITVPPWAAIAGNYDPAAGGGLAHLMDGFQPGVGGQLLLWHGPPGTGKTWALRALAWEWRAWADLHYITDPETFFGDRASYMLDVLLHDGDDGPVFGALVGAKDDPGEPPVPVVDPRAEGGRWKLLVLEDTGELMSADARDRAGQGLSRLLNVVDGLIGQGLRVLVLVTTNEELRSLHPAVQRPGRCASKILFGALSSLQAEAWLRERGASRRLTAATPVADLFAMLDERETAADRGRAPVGFAS
jgi:hypothetical protein